MRYPWGKFGDPENKKKCLILSTHQKLMEKYAVPDIKHIVYVRKDPFNYLFRRWDEMLYAVVATRTVEKKWIKYNAKAGVSEEKVKYSSVPDYGVVGRDVLDTIRSNADNFSSLESKLKEEYGPLPSALAGAIRDSSNLRDFFSHVIGIVYNNGDLWLGSDWDLMQNRCEDKLLLPLEAYI
ncbi:hypothetical protein DRN75_04300 [Nanoarchaeota archaeon]|nr:MAG: hypothetical protein DRN75_04300 [Nanoarchaeota archaeon]